MNKEQLAILLALLSPIWKQKSLETVSEWCERNIIFNEPKLNAPFSFGGREYLREMLNSWADNAVKDLIACMGTRTGKTRFLMGGAAWRIINYAMRCLWTLPATDGPGGARSFSTTRLQPMFRATPILAELIPTGATRHQFKALQQILGGSIIDFTGTGSPKQLGGNPCDVTIQDEVDGQVLKGDAEAHPSILIDQRTKEFSNPKRVKTSTPTIENGVIWQELLKTDLRRRFMPCPHCGKFVVFAWSEQYTVLPKTGSEAYVFWDKEAKKKDGWDFERVMKSAHAKCPFCAGHILDTHKTKMDRLGEWRPTKQGAPGYRGYHLPSMYSVTIETSFGHMAKRFLLAAQGLQGMKGFINSDLAEPDVSQEISTQRVEIISSQIEVKAEWTRLGTIDCQAKSPYFWAVARAWSESAAHGLEACSLDSWDDVEQFQQRHSIKNSCTLIDSGYGAKSDAEVYRNCAAHGEIVKVRGRDLPFVFGWFPAKGIVGHKRYKDPASKLMVPYRTVPIDPYIGTSESGTVNMELFEFASDYFKDILQNLRKGVGGKFKWSVPDFMATDTYWKHMDSQIKTTFTNRQTNFEVPRWEKRHRYWPDHLFDCEVMQVAFACFAGIIKIENK